MRTIIEAEIMSEGKNALRLYLSDGSIIEGFSLGIEPAFDEEGEELDYDVLVIDAYSPPAYYRLKDEDIISTERVT